MNASKLLKKWFINEGAGLTEEKWEDDKTVLQWFSESAFEIGKKIEQLKTEAVGRAVRQLCAVSGDGFLQGLKGYMEGLSRDERDAFAGDLASLGD